MNFFNFFLFYFLFQTEEADHECLSSLGIQEKNIYSANQLAGDVSQFSVQETIFF